MREWEEIAGGWKEIIENRGRQIKRMGREAERNLEVCVGL